MTFIEVVVIALIIIIVAMSIIPALLSSASNLGVVMGIVLIIAMVFGVIRYKQVVDFIAEINTYIKSKF